jgi:hypothetical protein
MSFTWALNHFSKLKVSSASQCHLFKFFLSGKVCATRRSQFYSKPRCHKIHTMFHTFLQLFYPVWSKISHTFLDISWMPTQQNQSHTITQTVITLQNVICAVWNELLCAGYGQNYQPFHMQDWQHSRWSSWELSEQTSQYLRNLYWTLVSLTHSWTPMWKCWIYLNNLQ